MEMIYWPIIVRFLIYALLLCPQWLSFIYFSHLADAFIQSDLQMRTIIWQFLFI